MIKKQIVVIEDNKTMRIGIVESLRRDGYEVSDFDNGRTALDSMVKSQPALVITDLKMQPLSGLEVLKQVKKERPATEVILISAFGTVETAVQAMQSGAADFLTKPFSNEELRFRVSRIWNRIEQDHALQILKEQNRLLREEIDFDYKDLIGASPAIKELLKMIGKIAVNDSTVLIEGESGTGKELIARAIHGRSNRKNGPFVKVNCGALNENLLESELFGHEKGAFTGAVRQKKGRFELANGGTLFLDEIGEIGNTMQVKLLRVLQEGEFERVGGETTIRSDVRIICATNKNLQQMVASGTFRDDLFYRLSVIPVVVPPLRQRLEDLPLLIDHFLTRSAGKNKRPVPKLDNDTFDALKQYNWPGNIRELENLVERLCVIAPEQKISAATVSRFLLNVRSPAADLTDLPLEEALFNFEKQLLMQAMKEAKGVKNRAARILGIKTSSLYYKLEKFGLI